MKIHELYAEVTATIIKQLEEGVIPWTRPWKSKGGGILPYNAATKKTYNGINIPILWHAQQTRGYPTNAWMTYKQALPLDAHVRKGEKGTTVVFTKRLILKNEDEEKQIAMLRTYTTFNVAQIDGLPPAEPEIMLPEKQRDDDATAFIAATKVDIIHGGDRACYVPSLDFVTLPDVTSFNTYEHYLATALHECVHWSGAKRRLDRDLNNRFGTKAYAAEELVAEFGAAFLCAHLGVKGELRHAEYINNWLQLLREDNRAVFTAVSKASQAAEYLRKFSEKIGEQIDDDPA